MQPAPHTGRDDTARGTGCRHDADLFPAELLASPFVALPRLNRRVGGSAHGRTEGRGLRGGQARFDREIFENGFDLGDLGELHALPEQLLDQLLHDHARGNAIGRDHRRFRGGRGEQTGRGKRHIDRHDDQHGVEHQFAVLELGAGVVRQRTDTVEPLDEAVDRSRPVLARIAELERFELGQHGVTAIALGIGEPHRRHGGVDIVFDAVELGGCGFPVVREGPHLVFIALGPLHADEPAVIVGAGRTPDHRDPTAARIARLAAVSNPRTTTPAPGFDRLLSYQTAGLRFSPTHRQ
uniref:hypothetical protein n=1 Tax=Nocardia acidivorans TaxID=404580 RepID=UPI0012FBF415|nr:hypothetical protein [Nocardia acidivorans]